MYVEPWIFWLILAPVAACMALYLLYVAFGLLILLGVYTLYGLTTLVEGTDALLTGSLRWLVSPFRQVGPWLDYVAATTVLAALVCIAALLA